MRILVVEDEHKTADYLKKGLSENGHVVDTANHGEDGLHLAMTEEYDLVVLDINLPGRDGWSILQTLRRAGRQVPVLILTASDKVEERVRGLNLGADDYLVKPFSMRELAARMHADWVGVVRTGEPGWPRHGAGREVQLYDVPPRVTALRRADALDSLPD